MNFQKFLPVSHHRRVPQWSEPPRALTRAVYCWGLAALIPTMKLRRRGPRLVSTVPWLAFTRTGTSRGYPVRRCSAHASQPSGVTGNPFLGDDPFELLFVRGRFVPGRRYTAHSLYIEGGVKGIPILFRRTGTLEIRRHITGAPLRK